MTEEGWGLLAKAPKEDKKRGTEGSRKEKQGKKRREREIASRLVPLF